MEAVERRLSPRRAPLPAEHLIYPRIITVILEDIQEDTATPRTRSTHLRQACITVGDMVAMEEVIFNERGEKKKLERIYPMGDRWIGVTHVVRRCTLCV